MVRVLCFVKKEFYHARRKNGKCKSLNQSISQLVAFKKKAPSILFWVHIGISLNAYTLEASTKSKQLRKHIFAAKRNLTTFPVTYARAKLGKIAALFPGGGVY